MTEAERAEAIAILQDIDAKLDRMRADMRHIQRSMTMIDLRLGILNACMDAREGCRTARREQDAE